MPENSPRDEAGGYRLVRCVNGRRIEPGDIDIEHAIESSSSPAALEELQQRGHGKVRVLDRDKIGALIRQAVNEAIDANIQAQAADQHGEIEQDALAQLSSLLAAQGQARAGQNAPAAQPSSLGSLASFLARGGGAAPAEDSSRLSAIEEQLQQLIFSLEQLERKLNKTDAKPPKHTRGTNSAMKSYHPKQREMLDTIYQENRRLQDKRQPHPVEEPGRSSPSVFFQEAEPLPAY